MQVQLMHQTNSEPSCNNHFRIKMTKLTISSFGVEVMGILLRVKLFPMWLLMDFSLYDDRPYVGDTVRFWLWSNEWLFISTSFWNAIFHFFYPIARIVWGNLLERERKHNFLNVSQVTCQTCEILYKKILSPQLKGEKWAKTTFLSERK